jgi:RNA polymerase sigma-70 factor (ECF subfamily)
MPASGLDFSSALQRARRGDQAAFGELVAPLERDLHAVAHRKLASLQARLDAADVTQQTLAAAWRGLSALEHQDEATFRVWLMAIHRHTLLKAIRDEHRIVRNPKFEVPLPASGSSAPAPGIALPDRQPRPSAIARKRELHERLVSHLSRLSEDHRLVLCLRFLEELSYEEIIQRTGLTEGQLQGRIRRALAALRESGSDLKTLMSGFTN